MGASSANSEVTADRDEHHGMGAANVADRKTLQVRDKNKKFNLKMQPGIFKLITTNGSSVYILSLIEQIYGYVFIVKCV